jgi:hypothetical protein
VKAGAVDEWNGKFPVYEDGVRYIECYFCWKELKEYDVVEIWTVPEKYSDKIDKGDLGAVLIVHGQGQFEVECVQEDGTTKWLETLPRNCMWYKSRPNS